jgi:hypothetical protein
VREDPRRSNVSIGPRPLPQVWRPTSAPPVSLPWIGAVTSGGLTPTSVSSLGAIVHSSVNCLSEILPDRRRVRRGPSPDVRDLRALGASPTELDGGVRVDPLPNRFRAVELVRNPNVGLYPRQASQITTARHYRVSRSTVAGTIGRILANRPACVWGVSPKRRDPLAAFSTARKALRLGASGARAPCMMKPSDRRDRGTCSCSAQ